MTKAVVLLSGGLDSATTLAIARDRRYECYALSIDYAQRHGAELVAAERVARSIGASEHRIVKVNLAAFGGSALTDASIAVPTEGIKAGIPVTYVPARNTIMLSLALRGPRCLEAMTFSSASMRWIIPVIRIAGLNTSQLSNKWRIWPPRLQLKAIS